MTEFVRVSLDGGHVSVSKEYAEAHGLKVLKQDAVDRSGKTLPLTPKTTVASKAAGSTTPSGSGPAATTQKETS